MWTGFYYDGRTANRQTVAVEIHGDFLRLTKPEGRVMTWPIASLRQSQGAHGRERLRLEFGTDPVESLVVEQPGLAEAMRALAPGANPGLRTRRDHTRLVGALLALVTVVIAGYVMGAPVFARWLAPRIPPAWEQEIGRASADAMLKSGPLCADSATVAGVRSVLDRLLAAAPHAPFPFTLYLSADTSVNAFAAPGGTVLVNAGLLRVAESPEELAGVLAHEVQHVLLRHSMQAVIREVPVRLAIASITGSGGVETAANVAGTLGVLKYRRDNEREADVQGQKLMLAARIDPTGAGRFMRRLESRREDAPRFAQYLSSHPRTAERAAELEKLASDGSREYEPLMDAAAWARVQSGCVPPVPRR